MDEDIKKLDFNETVFSWIDGDIESPKFVVKHISTTESRVLLRQCENRRSKTTSKLDQFDTDKLSRKRVNAAVISWEKLKKKHLSYILDIDMVSEWQPMFAEIGYEDIVEFTPDNKRVLVKYHNADFSIFLGQCVDDIQELKRVQADEQLKN